mmetsp:Transcript_6484/g.18891  ORF Transcript_6484/g.18891 Transcript_6484/m.18891 type:complete len:200 (-) Transcript_6484:45-644(-)
MSRFRFSFCRQLTPVPLAATALPAPPAFALAPLASAPLRPPSAAVRATRSLWSSVDTLALPRLTWGGTTIPLAATCGALGTSRTALPPLASAAPPGVCRGGAGRATLGVQSSSRSAADGSRLRGAASASPASASPACCIRDTTAPAFGMLLSQSSSASSSLASPMPAARAGTATLSRTALLSPSSRLSLSSLSPSSLSA